MADKRMFAKSIVGSDVFLDMKASSRALYFAFGVEADDDGFLGNPKAIMRKSGCADTDLKELVDKRYILMFDTGVAVIKHWRINNYIRKDRYKETTYIEEKAMLEFDEKGAYTEKGKGKKAVDIWEKQEEEYQKRYKKKKIAKRPNYDDLKGGFQND